MLWNDDSNSIELVVLSTNDDRMVENGIIDQSWEQIVSMMSTHELRADKDGPCFMPVKMKPMQEWELTPARTGHKQSYRNDKNVESISFAVLDLDKPGAREKAEEMFADFEYVMYSTHSYTAATPYKYRIVLKLDEPIKTEHWPELFKDLICGIDADKVCGNFSRIYYLPSTSPDADVSPFVKHNVGRDLTPSDIIENRKRFENSLSEEEKAELRKSRGISSGSAGKRHFSGRFIPVHELVSGSIDYSYEGMKKRHERFISELSFDDSRHNFAMRAISREIAKFGANTDIENLVKFLYKASEDFSSKSIANGDTSSEIPELIESSFLKFAPQAVDAEDGFIEKINKQVGEAIIKAKGLFVTKKWDFPSEAVAISNNKPLPVSVMNESGRYTYLSMKKRNIGAIRDLIENGDSEAFILKCMKDELQLGDESTNTKYVAQFCLFCIKNYFDKCENDISTGSKIESTVSSSIQNIEKMIPVEYFGDKQKLAKNIHASLLIAKKSAGPSNDWKFEQEPETMDNLPKGP